MKKLVRSNALSPRKLTMRSETIRALRVLTERELRGTQIAGGSNAVCDGSTLQPWSAMCD